TAFSDQIPCFTRHHLGVDLPFPEDIEPLALCIVLDARKRHKRAVTSTRWRDGAFYEIQALPYSGDLTGDRQLGG
ncbi:MAG: hypothetical protein B7Z73_05455, partial [Planctomycetia bacterium 21-64-5]